MDKTPQTIIVFYDGDCGFCNGTVHWVLKNRKKDILFAALQSEFAQQALNQHYTRIKMDTLFLMIDEKVFSRYKAVHQLCKHLKLPYSLFYYLGFLVPTTIGDVLYNQLAKRRHNITSQKCYIPSEDEKKFFLDLQG